MEDFEQRGLTKVSVVTVTFGFLDSRCPMIQWDVGKVKIDRYPVYSPVALIFLF